MWVFWIKDFLLSVCQNYLRKFYLHNSKTKKATSAVDKLREMQKFFGLPETGKLSPRVMEIMQKPRCGVPDVAEFSLMPNSPKWHSRIVTYRWGSLWLIVMEATKPFSWELKHWTLLCLQNRVLYFRLASVLSRSNREKSSQNMEYAYPTELQEG